MIFFTQTKKNKIALVVRPGWYFPPLRSPVAAKSRALAPAVPDGADSAYLPNSLCLFKNRKRNLKCLMEEGDMPRPEKRDRYRYHCLVVLALERDGKALSMSSIACSKLLVK